MPESVKVAMWIFCLCSIVFTVGACLFFKAAKQNDCTDFGSAERPTTKEV